MKVPLHDTRVFKDLIFCCSVANPFINRDVLDIMNFILEKEHEKSKSISQIFEERIENARKKFFT